MTAKRRLPQAPRAATRWTPELLAGVAAGERSVLADLLRRGEHGAPLQPSAEASRRAEELVRAALAREPPDPPIACRAGCPSCCQAKVLVTAPEALRIAEHLRATLDPDALAALIDRVRRVDERTRGLSRARRAAAHIDCPLLENGGCSIHEVRPLHCRGWTSLDVRACERYWADPEDQPSAPVYAVGYELTGAVLAGLAQACADAGYDGALLEFIAALRIALERPNAEERWSKGLGVFATARNTE